MKKFVFAVLSLVVMANVAHAADLTVEKWKHQGLKFVVRNEDGSFKTWGNLKLVQDRIENSAWTAYINGKDQPGQYTGVIEKYDLKGHEYEFIVIYDNSTNKPVAASSVQELVKIDWEKEKGKGPWYFVIRAKNGTYMDKGVPKVENWENGKEMCVVRTNQEGHKGQFLSMLAPEVVGNGVQYRVPAGDKGGDGGQFVGCK